MLPSDFEQKNKVYTKPEGWTDEQCSDLPVWQGKDVNGNSVIVSYWKPNKEDIETLSNGGGIYLKMITPVQCPVELTTESPFI